MAFFQDLGKKITDGVQDASKKTTELLEISKLNNAISSEKDGINADKIKIGDKMFGLFQAGEGVPDNLAEDLQSITARLDKITELEGKIAEIKAAAEAEKAAKAAAAPAAGGQPAGGTRFCSGCGAPLAAGAVFCSGCGKKND
jgi:uncharacterized Zn finger protein (UPF0148 family)